MSAERLNSLEKRVRSKMYRTTYILDAYREVTQTPGPFFSSEVTC